MNKKDTAFTEALLMPDKAKKGDECENISFEDALAALEKCAAELRGDNVSLEESIKIFEEGARLYEKCTSILDNAKQKIEVFSKE